MEMTDLGFRKLKGGDFTITGTITKQMVQQCGGVLAVVNGLGLLMMGESVLLSAPGVKEYSTPDTLARIREGVEQILQIADEAAHPSAEPVQADLLDGSEPSEDFVPEPDEMSSAGEDHGEEVFDPDQDPELTVDTGGQPRSKEHEASE